MHLLQYASIFCSTTWKSLLMIIKSSPSEHKLGEMDGNSLRKIMCPFLLFLTVYPLEKK